MTAQVPRSFFVLPLFAASLVFAGCAAHKPVPPPETAITEVTSAPASAPLAYHDATLSVSADLAQQCKLDFNNVDRAPRFDFNDSALAPSDRDVLDQVAKCVTTGPMKGHALKLVGRADPRGEAEYNLALGEHRSSSVDSYLSKLGVDRGKMVETSRGKLDATGTDEAGWARDRRVDIDLE